MVSLIGDASGIGAETVRAFASQGAKVGFVDKRETGGQSLLSVFEGDHVFATCDLCLIPDLQSAFAERAFELHPAEVSVNNTSRAPW